VKDWRAQRDEALLMLERDSRAAVRAEAAELLCDLAEAPARHEELSPVVPRLVGDTQPEVRCAGVALAARVLKPDDAAELLVRSLADRHERVRVEAAGRLADLGRPSARGVFAEALVDPSSLVRFEAARGMAALHHRAGFEVLVEALDDPGLRFRAVGALAELGDKAAIEPLQRLFGRWLLPAFDRTQTAGALAKLGAASGAAYLMSRSRRKWTVDRAMAVELLGEVKVPGAFERLLEVISDPKDSCRGAAARGLGRLGDARGLAPLGALLEDSTVPEDLRLDAAEGLCLLGGAEARARVTRAAAGFASEARAEVEVMLQETASS
jgi:HEAT repeat protein